MVHVTSAVVPPAPGVAVTLVITGGEVSGVFVHAICTSSSTGVVAVELVARSARYWR